MSKISNLAPFQFNPDLKFGVATAATQIEGGDTHNTWYRWTKDGTVTRDGSTSLRANSHWQNYKAHIDLMKELNLEIYRLGIEWARIEPNEGQFDDEVMSHYIDEIKYLKSKGIKPLVTLHHFSNPIWFEDLGGFKNKKCVEYFARFTRYVASKLKGLVTEWITINEPNVYAFNCFLFGEWINKEKSFFTTLKILRALARCHISAYKVLHDVDPNCRVGVANNLSNMIACGKGPIAKFEKWFADRTYNMCVTTAMCTGRYLFPMGLKRKSGKYYDFFGINHYNTHIIKGLKQQEIKDAPHNNFGWGITPSGLRAVCERFHKLFNADIYITENGTADRDDKFRSQFLYDFLYQIHDLPYVKRYYHWTFMDNFEWQAGESMCFGLVKYNYQDGTYTVRNSGYFYRDLIKAHEINQEMIDKYQLDGSYHE